MSFLSMLHCCIKSIFSTDEANRKLYRENYFSEEFLLDALQGVGFKSVEVASTEEGAIHLGAKLFDERGNSFTISVHHLGNVINFSAQPNYLNEMQVPKNINCISITKTFQKKYIETSEESKNIFGNEAQTDLLWKCKEKADQFLEELKDEFKRRNKFI